MISSFISFLIHFINSLNFDNTSPNFAILQWPVIEINNFFMNWDVFLAKTLLF